MKVAIVHDWLDSYRGGEKVLEQILTLYPNAPVYTLFYNPEKLPDSISKRKVIAPFYLKPFHKIRKLLLPVFPLVVEFINLKEFDLVISTSSCVVKSVKTRKDAVHVCYIHSPMRYIWDQMEEYIAAVSYIPLAGYFIKACAFFLRIWDVKTSKRVDHFVVNSEFVKERVRRLYHRDSVVVHPPVEIDRFLNRAEKKDYYLVAGAMVSYKRFDLAIEAAKLAGVKLIVAGSGPMESKLRALASDQVEFIIRPSDEKWCELMAEAKAFLFPGTEDFGITAIEALASGAPLIAYKEGGALDFVNEDTGIFFEEKTPESLARAIKDFENRSFDQNKITSFSERFCNDRFLKEIKEQINIALKGDKL